MTGNAADLLPPASSAPFERALAKAMSDPLPVERIREVLDPDTAPEEWLPFLAFGESVDLWFDDWPVARKRFVIKEWPRLAGLIGTKAAAPEFLALVDAEIVDTVTYPTPFVIGKTPLGHGMTIHQDHHKVYYLVRISPRVADDHFIIGTSRISEAFPIRDVDNEPLERVRAALRAAKVPETQYAVDYGHKRKVTFDDAWPFDTPRPFDLYIDRTRL